MSSLPTAGDPRQQWVRLLEDASRGHLESLVSLLDAEPDAHAALLRLLTHLDFEMAEARLHWNRLLRHRLDLSEKLGREASLQLAALDYFQNLRPSLSNPKLIEMEAYLATERNAITDGLTGLYNRQFFDVSLRRELKRARRYGLAFSLVLMDVDDFKAINDVHGHVVGDAALTVCSDVIRASVREIDVPCRYGGEEFALILPETSRTGAFIVSERIRLDVHEVFEKKPIVAAATPPVDLSVSGGIAIYPTDSNSAEGLLLMADKALYRSKHEGKNKITLHADEKRRSPRLDARNLLVFRERRPDEARTELQSETRNLSRSGALVESQIPLKVGTELELSIILPQDQSRYVLKGRVVRLEEAPEASGEEDRTRTRYYVGVAFIIDTDEDARKLESLASEIYAPIEQYPHRDLNPPG